MQVDCFPNAPPEWSRQVFADVAAVNPPYKLDKSKEYPFVEMASVAEDFGGIVRFDLRKAEASGLARFRHNDILFGKITPCAENGKVALVNHLPADYALGSTEFIVLSPRPAFVPRFVYALACSTPVLGRAISRMEGSTGRLRVTEDTFTKWLLVPVPPLDEQQAIARILDAVDAAIERTRTASEKAQRVKRGLMQQLLPPWFGFKHLPREAWPDGVEIVPAAQVARIVNGSTPSRTEPAYWRDGSIPWLATGKVNERIINHADECVTPKALAECSIELLPVGTVLVGMIGQGKTRGMTAYLNLEACINQNFGAFVPDRRLLGKWLFHYLDFNYTFLREIGGGTNQGALNCYLLKRIQLPVLLLEQQRMVADRLDACDSMISSYGMIVDRLLRLKRGLMQDLLTGKVRVGCAAAGRSGGQLPLFAMEIWQRMS